MRVLSLPHDYTLFYCLAVALFYEGLMSATYHICPTRLLFTIDTTFMFCGSLFISLEVYRKWFRSLPHPMFPFCLLTCLMVFNYFGTFLGELQTVRCFLFCFVKLFEDLYNVDSSLVEADLAPRVMWSLMFVLLWCGCIIIITVRHRSRMPLRVLLFLMVANCLFGFLPVLSFLSVKFADRSSLLLGVALLSAIFNLFAYVVGTLHRVDLATKLFRFVLGAIAFACAGPAVYFFGISPSNKAESPWSSRAMNAPCISSGFYDAHDIWHFLSAVALAATIFLLMHSGEQSGNEGYSSLKREEEHALSSGEAPSAVFVDESTPLVAK